jgi:hypothetical protein
MDNLPDNHYKSRYGIDKLRDHNYQNWSFQCRMLLSEKKVWKVVSGELARPPTIAEIEAEMTAEELTKFSAAERKRV